MGMGIRIGALALALAGCGQQAIAGQARDRLAAQLPQWLEQSNTPSAAVALVEHGQVRWTLVVGDQAPGIPAGEATLYNVASLAKPVTAEIALRVSAAGRASLDSPMHRDWTDPDLVDDPHLPALTAWRCLSHQCGFPNWRSETDGLVIEWPPGSRAGYSGEGYEYVARWLEARTGQLLQAIASQYVFEPEGMSRTSYVRQPWFDGNVAIPRGPDGDDGEPVVRSDASAADDLYTTIGDFGRFAAAVVDGEGMPTPGAGLRWEIDHDQVGQVCRPGRLQGEACPERMGFATGWVRLETGRDTVFFHGGGDWGERAFVMIVPEQRWGAVVLTNGAGGMAVVRDVFAELYPDPVLEAFLTMQAGG